MGKGGASRFVERRPVCVLRGQKFERIAAFLGVASESAIVEPRLALGRHKRLHILALCLVNIKVEKYPVDGGRREHRNVWKRRPPVALQTTLVGAAREQPYLRGKRFAAPKQRQCG